VEELRSNRYIYELFGPSQHIMAISHICCDRSEVENGRPFRAGDHGIQHRMIIPIVIVNEMIRRYGDITRKSQGLRNAGRLATVFKRIGGRADDCNSLRLLAKKVCRCNRALSRA
jgi:hypothetical protein